MSPKKGVKVDFTKYIVKDVNENKHFRKFRRFSLGHYIFTTVASYIMYETASLP